MTQPLAWDMFCNGMAILPDGRAFVVGGTKQYDPFYGAINSSAYDPMTLLFTDLPNMNHGAPVSGDEQIHPGIAWCPCGNAAILARLGHDAEWKDGYVKKPRKLMMSYPAFVQPTFQYNSMALT